MSEEKKTVSRRSRPKVLAVVTVYIDPVEDVKYTLQEREALSEDVRARLRPYSLDIVPPPIDKDGMAVVWTTEAQVRDFVKSLCSDPETFKKIEGKEMHAFSLNNPPMCPRKELNVSL